MSKDPAFLFYHHDFIVGTAFMSLEERGAYISILCYMADKGPMSLNQIKKVCGNFNPDDLLKEKFLFENGLYYNKRLLEEVDKRKAFCESRRISRTSNIRQSYDNRMVNENENITKQLNHPTNIKSKKQIPNLDSIIKELELIYDYINIRKEVKKMQAWLLANPGRSLTKKFMVNWLNKYSGDEPIKADKPAAIVQPKIKPEYLNPPKLTADQEKAAESGRKAFASLAKEIG